jgi:formylglycine-generating enzyme required for sulfatase activity
MTTPIPFLRALVLHCLLFSGLVSLQAAGTTPSSPTAPTLGAWTIPSKVYGSAPFTIKPPTSSSKGAWSYTSSDSSVATVSGSQVTIVGAGSALITATQSAAGNSLSATTSATFTVTPAVPKLGTFMIPTKRYGSGPVSLTPPTSTSPGSWSYTSGNTAVATIRGSSITITGAGSTMITATQAATRNFTSASKAATFKVTPGTPVLGSFVIPPQYLGSGSFTLTPPQSTSSGSWSYASSKPKVATVSGSTVTLTGAGTTTITAVQAATVNWLSAKTNALLVVTTTAPTPPVTTDTFGTGTNQFTIDFVGIGNPGNPNDTTGYGGVPYDYRIGKYTISQNQIDAATRNGLQNVTAGYWNGDKPAANISWYEAAAYVNWLNTSQGYAPAYNLTFTNGNWNMALWPTTPDGNGNVAWTNGGTNFYRNANCLYFLPSENEWYKAAYYDPAKNGGSGGYWLYPTGSDNAPSPVASGTSAGTAVFSQPPWENGPASVFQAGGLSPYGTMGQGGNIWQWEESAWDGNNDVSQEVRGFRGGFWSYYADFLRSSFRGDYYPGVEDGYFGFRVARRTTPPPPPITSPTTDTFGTGSNQFTIDFVGIGNPGNSNDPTTGYGGVPYSYRMGKYTISENQVDAATRNGLQNVTAGYWSGDQPAGGISWYEAAAYVNWLNTSQGYAPAYNLTFTNGAWSMGLWPTTPDGNGNVAWTNGGNNLYRNANCVYFLPSENEWYKSAYYDPAKNGGSGGYWLYPTGSDTAPTAVGSGTSAGTAVFNQPWGNGPASVFQAGGLSPYGTMGQGGNFWQWEESAWDGNNDASQEARGILGGCWGYSTDYLPSSFRGFDFTPGFENHSVGFRVARKP